MSDPAADHSETEADATRVPASGPIAAGRHPGKFPFLAPAQQPDEVGRLGPYRVLGVLGQGGMGVVFAAEDPALRRQIALKVMLPQFAADPDGKARFQREARAQAAVEHEHVIAIFQVGEENGVPFIAMPRLKGVLLSDAMRSGVRPPVGEALRVAREVAEGLAAAHDTGLIHRDIKPANVWLDGPRRRVKILDFGLARTADGPDRAGGDAVTQSGLVLGTPAYMSPEQAHGLPLDPRSDLFSLGTVLYELLTGAKPFQGPTTLALLNAVTGATPPPPSALNPEVPPGVDAVVGWLLAKNPAGRPPTAHAAADALRAAEGDASRTVVIPTASVVATAEHSPWTGLDAVALDTGTVGVTPTGTVVRPPAPPRPAGSFKLLGVAVAALVTLAGLGVGVVLMARGGGTAAATTADEPPPTRRPAPTRKAVPVPAPAPDPDRRAAEYVLGLGGQVWVSTKKIADDVPHPWRHRLLSKEVWVADRPDPVTAADKLPQEPFRVLAFHMVNCPGVTDDGLAVFKDCRHLEKAALGGTPVTDAALAHFAGCANLQLLDVAGARVTDAGLAHLKGCRALAYLHFAGTGITDAGVRGLAGCDNLTSLDLTGTAVTDEGAAVLPGFANLKLLWLPKTKVTPDRVKQIAAALPGCRIWRDGGEIDPSALDRRAAEFVLAAGGWVQVDGTADRVTAPSGLPAAPFRLTFASFANKPLPAGGLAPFLGLQHLAGLSLQNTPTPDVFLALLAPLRTLTHLDLYGAGITDTGLVFLMARSNLTLLSLRGPGVTDTGVARLAGMTDLAHLNLSETRVTDAGLAHLRKCQKLAAIYLDGTPVTDAGLSELAGREALTTLDLSGTKVSDAGLPVLVGTKNLRQLDLRRTKVTADGVKRLAAALPQCDIAWDGPPDPKPDVPGTFTNPFGMKFVPVPKGRAVLGGRTLPGGLPIPNPGVRHAHIPDDFFLGKYEVTQAVWEAVTGKNPSGFHSNAAHAVNVQGLPAGEVARFPVENVSWDDCQAFLAKLNEREKGTGWVYRLPTEAEWEYACRGGPPGAEPPLSGYDYYVGAEPSLLARPEHMNFLRDDKTARPVPVGSYPANRLGLYDMHGNVWEWCDDALDGADRGNRPGRGGSWDNRPGQIPAAGRQPFPTGSRLNSVGLRVARVPAPPVVVLPLPMVTLPPPVEVPPATPKK